MADIERKIYRAPITRLEELVGDEGIQTETGFIEIIAPGLEEGTTDWWSATPLRTDSTESGFITKLRRDVREGLGEGRAIDVDKVTKLYGKLTGEPAAVANVGTVMARALIDVEGFIESEEAEQDRTVLVDTLNTIGAFNPEVEVVGIMTENVYEQARAGELETMPEDGIVMIRWEPKE